jgi:hypothetical protein
MGRTLHVQILSENVTIFLLSLTSVFFENNFPFKLCFNFTSEYGTLYTCSSVVEQEPQGARTFGWSRSRHIEVSAPAPGSGSDKVVKKSKFILNRI